MKREINNRDMRAEHKRLIDEASVLGNRKNLSRAQQSEFDDLMEQAADWKRQYTEYERREAGAGPGGSPPPAHMDDGSETRTTTRQEKETRDAFRSYIRFGKNDMPSEHRAILEARETRDMGIQGGNSLTGPSGSFLVPIGFSNTIETALKFSGNLMKYCTTLPTATGAPMPYPTSDDTQQQCELIGENQQVTTGDVPLSNVIFGAYKFSSKLIKVSLELAQDSAFDIESWLTGVLATRFARGLNSYFTTGRGSTFGEPMGLITAAAAAGNIVTATGSAANTGVVTDGGNTIGTNDLQNLIHSVDVAYRDDPSCMFLCHDQTAKFLNSVLDKYGRPLLQPSLTQGAPAMLAGFPVGIDNAMATLAPAPSSPTVSKYVMAFGPMNRYIFRRVLDMSLLVLRERFADYAQLGFIAYMRADGNLVSGAQESAQSPIALLRSTY